MLIAKDLDLDVPWADDVLLDVDRVIAEGALRLTLRGGERGGELGTRVHDAHSLSPAAGRGLEQHGVAELLGDRDRLVGVAEGRRRAGDDRRTSGDCERARRRLAAHRRDRLRRWTHPDEARIAHGACEPLTLAEEAVARMNRLRTRLQCGGNDRVALEIRFRGWSGTDQHCLVGLAHVGRTRVGFGVHGDCANAELTAGTNHTKCDLASIGDQQLGEHHSGMFPCFFGGLRSRLVRIVSSASMRRGRVSRGSMMSSR